MIAQRRQLTGLRWCVLLPCTDVCSPCCWKHDLEVPREHTSSGRVQRRLTRVYPKKCVPQEATPCLGPQRYPGSSP